VTDGEEGVKKIGESVDVVYGRPHFVIILVAFNIVKTKSKLFFSFKNL